MHRMVATYKSACAVVACTVATFLQYVFHLLARGLGDLVKIVGRGVDIPYRRSVIGHNRRGFLALSKVVTIWSVWCSAPGEEEG